MCCQFTSAIEQVIVMETKGIEIVSGDKTVADIKATVTNMSGARAKVALYLIAVDHFDPDVERLKLEMQEDSGNAMQRVF